MKSQWVHLKHSAVQMRRHGFSVRDIENKLGISRSTLSGWFKDVKLPKKHRDRLRKCWVNALVSARQKAVVWHNAQKTARLAQAKNEALASLSSIDIANPYVIELALSLLYLGEGAKKALQTSLGNSDPCLLRFFISALGIVYKVPSNEIKCDLHLRADQSPTKEMQYWSHELGIPVANFSKPVVDKRTKGSPTYDRYHGVCVVRCGRVAIQRKLVYIATTFCNRVAESKMRG